MLGLAALASALLGCFVATAGAQVVLDTATHTRFGIAPTLARSESSAPAIVRQGAAPALQGPTCDADNEDCTKLTYKGGPVQHAESDYLFFWGPTGHALPSTYVSGIQTWLSAVAGADYSPDDQFAVDQQYYDLSGPGGAKSYVPYAIDDADTVIDTDSYPTSECTDKNGNGSTLAVCLTDGQIVSELSSYITAHHLPTGIDTEYFVLTPEGVGSCFDSNSSECSYTGYCGYHSFAGSGSAQILYADLPWAYKVPGCDVDEAFGTGYANSDFIDPVVSVFSHEMSETMTDPNLDAWIQEGGADAGYEVADKCAYIYGSGGYGSMSGLSYNGSGYWNVSLEGDDYLMQLEFDNRLGNCALQDTDTQPTVSVSVAPATPAPGSQATYTAKITDPAGVKSVEWNFGDGTTASGSSVEHVYAAAGTKTLTVLVVDEHGNEKRVTESVTVTTAPSGGGEGGSKGEGGEKGDGEGAGHSGEGGSSGSSGNEGGADSGGNSYGAGGGSSTTSGTTTLSGSVAPIGLASATTGGAAGGKNTGTKAASKGARCKTVVRRVHGHKRKLKICTRAKAKVKKADRKRSRV
jgi:PKD domain/Phosphate-induced protein 1 conserved region